MTSTENKMGKIMNGSQDGAIDASTMMASTQAVLDDNHDSAESNYSSDRIPSSSSHPRHDFEKLNEINQRKRPRAENDDSKQPTASAHRIRRVGKAPLLEPTEPKAPPRRSVFISKQDIQWNLMYDKLTAFQQNFQNTMVPQCFDGDPCLGRWVHYQRVEYWLYRSTGKAKITQDRINRLERLGFDWDPQKSQWEHMFEKLQAFQKEKGHCQVPKGYGEDPPLANWVRNQRLEFAHLQKGKKSRMTDDRKQRLDAIGFRWSNTKLDKTSLNGIHAGAVLCRQSE